MIELAILKSFDSTDYRAEVQLTGSLTTYLDDIPVARNIASSQMTAGRMVALLLPGDNPRDAAVIAVWDRAAGGGGGIENLNDIGDVSVPAPADDDILYWDDGASKWQARALADGDIPAAIARDAEVTADIATHAALPTVHQDAPALIATHAALPTVHQDAPALIATHAALTTGVHSFDKSCRVYHSVSQTLTTGVLLFSAFDTEIWDSDAIHNTVTNNSRLTCKTAGKYVIGGGGQFFPNATGRRHAQIRLNGSTVIATQHLQAVTDANAPTSLSVNTIYELAVNDYAELGFFQASGVDLSISGGVIYSPWFAMVRVA